MGGAALPRHSQLVVAFGLFPLYFIPTEEKGRCTFLYVRSANFPCHLSCKLLAVVACGNGILALDAGGVGPQSNVYVCTGNKNTLYRFGVSETALVKSRGGV